MAKIMAGGLNRYLQAFRDLATQPGPATPVMRIGAHELSIQVSRLHYCEPRKDKGPWTTVEVSIHDDNGKPVAIDELRDYFDGSVYCYVPITTLVDVIDKYGGPDLKWRMQANHAVKKARAAEWRMAVKERKDMRESVARLKAVLSDEPVWLRALGLNERQHPVYLLVSVYSGTRLPLEISVHAACNAHRKNLPGTFVELAQFFDAYGGWEVSVSPPPGHEEKRRQYTALKCDYAALEERIAAYTMEYDILIRLKGDVRRGDVRLVTGDGIEFTYGSIGGSDEVGSFWQLPEGSFPSLARYWLPKSGYLAPIIELAAALAKHGGVKPLPAKSLPDIKPRIVIACQGPEDGDV